LLWGSLLHAKMKNKFYILLLKIARFLLAIYWKLTKPLTIGVRAIILDKEEKFLLVRHRGTTQWYLPGGQVNAKETLIEALKREIREETGIMIAKDSGIEILGCYSGFAEGKSDHSLVFVIRNIGPMNSSPQSIEIDDCSFFAYEEIPRTVSPGTYRRLREYVKEIPISYEW
jgi:ADP-ribose pyrophosphatase YjhB (NUDIX family)